MAEIIKVTIWNEGRHDKTDPRVKELYPEGMHSCIKEFLSKNADLEIRTATLDDPDQGLPDELLNDTDVLIWWGHIAHHLVSNELAEAKAAE